METTAPGQRPVLHLLRALPDLLSRVRRNPPPERLALLGLMVGAAALFVLGVQASESWFPPVVQTLPMLAGGVLLRSRSMRRLLILNAVFLVWDLAVLGLHEVRPGAIVVLLTAGLVALEFARSREETGLGALRSDTVLLELRDRLELQGALPALAHPWRAEAVIRPAGAVPFAGDFLVSACADGGARLDVALVDVSGKGVEAGTRSLLLSGALGGLLSALPPEGFLAAANTYLLAQDWEEGFATACHLTVDLRTGDFAVDSAGHPPLAHFDAGSGTWSLLEPVGPALGLLPGASYDVQRGHMRPGDALLLYTDGLVEVPGRDLWLGIDKLLGVADQLVAAGFEGGAELLVSRAAPDASDDRGLVLLWRAV